MISKKALVACALFASMHLGVHAQPGISDDDLEKVDAAAEWLINKYKDFGANDYEVISKDVLYKTKVMSINRNGKRYKVSSFCDDGPFHCIYDARAKRIRGPIFPSKLVKNFDKDFDL